MTAVMLLPTATRCASCGARIRWCYSALGGRVPIDAEPDPDGTLVLVLIDGRWVAEGRRGYRAIALRELGGELYRHHHCEL